MPVVLLLMGAATLALVASNSYAKTPKSRPSSSPYQLDPHIEPALRAQVETALNYDNDPAHLDAFAHALEAYYPYAAWYLRAKAVGLRRMGYGAQAALPASGYAPGAAPVGRDDGLDPNLPDDVRFNVAELLSMGADPATIEAFAAQLGAYPKAQAALRLRAAFLRSTQAPPPAAHASGVPSPASPSPTFPALPGFDANLAPEAAMQIAQVLMTENDPSKLRALASSIQAQYPLAAAMLNAKANAIAPPAAAPASQVPPGTAAAPPAPTLTPAAPPAAPQLPWTPPVAASPDAVPAAPQVPAAQPLPQVPGLFDPGMTPDDMARISTALTSENDPAKLRVLADSIASRYPNAALLLTNKAAAISALLIPRAGAPTVLPAGFPSQSAAPAAAAQPPLMSVRSYKVESGDFPIKIAKKYGQPESAWKDLVAANPKKARKDDGNFKTLLPGEVLGIPASWPDRPGAQDVPAPSGAASNAPAISLPSVPAPLGAIVPPGTAALDPGMPANVVQAVLTALASEDDPATLRGFAASIMAQYPIAAGVLLAKANTLGTFAHAPGGGAAAPTPSILHLPSGSPAPVAGGRSYKVVSGDSPSRIAKKLTGNDARWPELVAANPAKAKKADGNFKNLQPGEVLTVPASWPATPNGAPASAA